MAKGNLKARLEIIAVLVTAAGKFVFMDYLQVRLPFIVCAIVFWLTYILWNAVRAPERTRHWGFRLDNMGGTLRMLIPFAILSCIAFFLVGYLQGTINLTWHIFPILILYPLWGTIQQFLLISLVAGNLRDIAHKQDRHVNALIIILAALLFAGIHYPWYWLMAGTFVLALLYGYVFLKAGNIYVLGIFHGWLGALFFYTVVGRDPFVEVFGKYL
jgi:uncharacterized protein